MQRVFTVHGATSKHIGIAHHLHSTKYLGTSSFFHLLWVPTVPVNRI